MKIVLFLLLILNVIVLGVILGLHASFPILPDTLVRQVETLIVSHGWFNSTIGRIVDLVATLFILSMLSSATAWGAEKIFGRFTETQWMEKILQVVVPILSVVCSVRWFASGSVSWGSVAMLIAIGVPIMTIMESPASTPSDGASVPSPEMN